MGIELSPESWQVLIAFACYLTGVAALGIFAHRYLSRGSFVKEYFLGNRGLGPWVLALTVAATAISGGTFMGFPSLIYTNGWVMALWICSYMVVPIMSMALMGKRLNQVARIGGSVTLPDVFRDRFRSPTLGILASLLILFFLVFNLVAQFKAGGLVMEKALSLRPAAGQFRQHRVREDLVRLHLRLRRFVPAELAEHLEECRVGTRRQRPRLAPWSALGVGCGEPDEPHLPLAVHHFPRRRVQLQHGVFALALRQYALVDELVHPVAQVVLGHVLQQAVGAQAVMLKLANPLGVLTAHHGNDIRGTEVLLEPRDTGQNLLRHHRGIGHRLRVPQADVACSTGGRFVLLAEVLDQRAVPAGHRRAKVLHHAQVPLRLLRRGPCQVAVHPSPEVKVVAAPQQITLGVQPVAAGAAGFLLIVLQRLRRSHVHDEPHVRLVDPHAERHGRHNDVDPLVDERLLVVMPLLVG